jgi:glutamyl-tRNA synthetase
LNFLPSAYPDPLTCQEKGYEPEALLNFLALMGWDHHSALEELARRQQQLISPSSSSSAGPGDDHPLAADSTDIPADGTLLPPQTRSDSHSYYDIFTPGQLVAAFSLEHVNHRKAAVNLSKLDFINKLTLRRKAGRLGDDGVMVERGKEGLDGDVTSQGHEVERADLISRVQDMLREQKVLKGK